MQEKVAAVLFLHGFGLILEVDEAALEFIPHGEVVHVVEPNKGVESKYENLKIYQRW